MYRSSVVLGFFLFFSSGPFMYVMILVICSTVEG